ncbi:hypothetical protein DFH06DRAFT_1465726 [Mycena polygramma]|nr:hypothetical protein DFH06DRAFT_1465726 [Mycena polygramma]
MVVDDLREKPVGYSKVVQSCEILKAVIKIDNNLLDNGVTRVDAGLCEYVGMLWTLYGRKTELVMARLRPIFLPLLRAAGDAYLNAPRPQAKTRTKNVEPETKELQRVKRLPADLQFILNVRAVQKSSGVLSSASAHNLLAVPAPWLTVMVIQPPLSPSAFDQHPPAADHADILTADLNEFESQRLDLARAGAATVGGPRSVLQATRYLEQVLTARKPTPHSPVTLSLAVEELMHELLNFSPDAVPRSGGLGQSGITMPTFDVRLAKADGAVPAEATNSNLPGVAQTPKGGNLLGAFEYEASKIGKMPAKAANAGQNGNGNEVASSPRSRIMAATLLVEMARWIVEQGMVEPHAAQNSFGQFFSCAILDRCPSKFNIGTATCSMVLSGDTREKI